MGDANNDSNSYMVSGNSADVRVSQGSSHANVPRIPECDRNADHRREYGNQYRPSATRWLATDPNGDTLTYSLEGDGTAATLAVVDVRTMNGPTLAYLGGPELRDQEYLPPSRTSGHVPAFHGRPISHVQLCTIRRPPTWPSWSVPDDSDKGMTQTVPRGSSIAELFVAIDDYFDGGDQHSRVVRSHRRLLRVRRPTVGCQVFSWYPTADDAVMCTARPHLIGTKERTRFM